MPLSNIHDRFRVSCLPHAAETAKLWGATHVISLLDPELPDHRVPVIADAEHVVVRLRDQESSDRTMHFPDIIVSLFEMVKPAAEQDGSRILVHCHAGVSRSTAMTLSLIAHRAGKGREKEAFAAFSSLLNKPWPNRRIVEILDHHMERGGALLAELDAMRARYPRRIDAYDRFNEKRGLFVLFPRYER